MTYEQNETQKGTAKQLFFLVKICLNLSPQDFCCVLHYTMCILGSTMALWSKAEIQKYTF